MTDVSELLESVRVFVERFVVLPGESAKATVALFVLHTWTVEAAATTPYIVVASPERQSGKTRLLEVLTLLVRKPWHCASASEAALFRKVQEDEPTLLLDETDATFGSHTERTEPLRALLNAGNRRGATVARIVGTKMEVRDFAVFCPKVLAGIDTGRLPETIIDRAIVLRMQRRRDDEHVERLRERIIGPEAAPLRDALEAWAAEAIDPLRDALPDLPDELGDRAGDAWEPLFAIADLAGGEWPARARAAAIELSAPGEGEEIGRGTQLLAAIREALNGEDAIFTTALLKAINDNDELPFGAWNERTGLDARGLARQLRPYGIRPHTIRIGDVTAKGYGGPALHEALTRYAPTPASQASQPSHDAQPAAESPRQPTDVTDVTDVTDTARTSDARSPSDAHVRHVEPPIDADAELARLREKGLAD